MEKTNIYSRLRIRRHSHELRHRCTDRKIHGTLVRAKLCRDPDALHERKDCTATLVFQLYNVDTEFYANESEIER